MKFRTFNDIHLDHKNNYTWIPKPLKEDKETVLFIPGDIATFGTQHAVVDFLNTNAKRFREIVLILGNHDYWGNTIEGTIDILKDKVNHTNVHILEKEVIEIDGVKIGGTTMWTPITHEMDKLRANGMMNDFHLIKKFKAEDWNREFNLAADWIKANPVDILLTHFVPLRVFTPPMFIGDEANFLFNCDIAAEMYHLQYTLPKYWLFGHTHWNFDVEVFGTKFICNAVGYTKFENTGTFKDEIIYEYNYY